MLKIVMSAALCIHAVALEFLMLHDEIIKDNIRSALGVLFLGPAIFGLGVYALVGGIKDSLRPAPAQKEQP